MHDNSFCHNDGYKELIFPPYIEDLGTGSFCENFNLENVVLPKYILGLDNNFNGCPDIKRIKFTTRSIFYVYNSFNDIDFTECLLVIPDGTREYYDNIIRGDHRSFFGKFKHIVEKSQEPYYNKSDSSVNGIPIDGNEQDVQSFTIDGIRIGDGSQANPGEIVIERHGENTIKYIKR
ncbi:MAG: hypothetical protein NC097_06435 [Clostridium sp.]|nr:hypothetical protein [Prevotella sp.]MCM1429417.1 hypothetical protein [Clostridium sp.]MCM1475548.1 hypothetical protein [Muribaculaceae bacterium]